MEAKYNQILASEVSPLIPFELLDEYNDFINPALREILRANCLRRYLEGAIDLLIKGKVIQSASITEKQWDKLKLYKKIEKIREYYSTDIADAFDELRHIGNPGSHFGNEVSRDDICKGIDVATKIVEMVLVEYFKTYPAGSQAPVLTLLSALPPRNRIYIWERIIENGQNDLWVTDKLSMAYLKNGQYEKSLAFLKEQKDRGIIDEEEHENFVQKINMLHKSLDKFDIAQNILDVKRIFETIAGSKTYQEYDEFLNIFLVLVSGYNLGLT